MLYDRSVYAWYGSRDVPPAVSDPPVDAGSTFLPRGATSMATAEDGLPNFLIIGAMRSGTSSLAYYLRGLPDVFMARNKELHFFTDRFDRGVDWYRCQFEGSAGHSAVGEATPTYMYDPMAVERMGTVVPDAKLVAVLRNPVDRAYSHYWHQVDKKRESASFADAVAMEPERLAGTSGIERRAWAYLEKGDYVSQLTKVCEVYPRDALHVMLFEDLRDRPDDTIASLCAFLGVDRGARPSSLRKVVNPHIRVRSEWVREKSRRLPKRLQDLVGRVNAPRAEYAPMDPETRGMLERHFAARNDMLAAWLGRDLSVWAN
jgi:Sulfotransferase domain